MKKTIKNLTVIFLITTLVVAIWPAVKVNATGTSRNNVSVVSTVVENNQKQPTNSLKYHENFYLKINWDASIYGTELQSGDYFDISISDNIKFPTDQGARDFEVLGPGGQVVGNGQVIADEANGGGVVRITLSDYVVNKDQVKGMFYLSALFNKDKVKFNETNQIMVTLGQSSAPASIYVEKAADDFSQDMLVKWPVPQDPQGNVPWRVMINFKKQDCKNLVVTDELWTKEGDLYDSTYVEGSFILEEVIFAPNGGVIQKISSTDISDQVVLSKDKTSFTYNLGDIGQKQYRIIYKTTYTKGITLGNRVTLTGDQMEPITQSASFTVAQSGGEAIGAGKGKIKITNTDLETGVGLQNGKFLVTKDDGAISFIVKTGAEGWATTRFLEPGSYTVVEIETSKGYILDETEYTVVVTEGEIASLTVPNGKVKEIVAEPEPSPQEPSQPEPSPGEPSTGEPLPPEDPQISDNLTTSADSKMPQNEGQVTAKQVETGDNGLTIWPLLTMIISAAGAALVGRRNMGNKNN